MLYGRAWPRIAELWDAMEIDPKRLPTFKKIAAYAIANRDKYLNVEHRTGVPWAMIACMHKRESDAQDSKGNPLFTSYLGNGQPLNKVTTIVPKGRGPFKSFLDGAVDALEIDKLTLVDEWRLEKQLFYMEALNGFGYRTHGIPSTYIWGGTNVQEIGRFDRDGHFVAEWDKQPGCAPMLWSIMKLDPLIECVRED